MNSVFINHGASWQLKLIKWITHQIDLDYIKIYGNVFFFDVSHLKSIKIILEKNSFINFSVLQIQKKIRGDFRLRMH